MKNKNNWIGDSVLAFKRIDKITSNVLLYYCSILGFIFGWVSLGILLFTITGTLPVLFVLLLRVFYFLISFLFGLKLTLYFTNAFRKEK